MAHVILTDDNFQKEVMDSSKPVLVDFWATWCGPCQMLGPIIEEVDKEMYGRVVVGKMNVDENPKISGQMQIMGIPTVILFKDGKEVEKIVGLQPKEAYIKAINNVLG